MKSNDKNLLFNLVLGQAKLSKLVNARLSKILARHRLSLSQWQVLGVIKEGKGLGLSMTAVATATEMSLSQVTTVSSSLINHRLVRQKTQAADRRSRHLIITDRGSRLLKRVETNLRPIESKLVLALGSDNKLAQNMDDFAHVLRELTVQKEE